MKHTLISKVIDYKLRPSVTKEILTILKSFEGKSVIITIERASSKRSIEQNSYLHLLFDMFKNGLNEHGHDFTSQRVKDLCKRKFLETDEIDIRTGEVIGQRIKDTSELNKLEMAEFIDKVIWWAADFFHIVLPPPSTQLTIE